MSTTTDRINEIHSYLITEADEECDYDIAWSMRFNAGYSAALIDMLRWTANGDDLTAKANTWVTVGYGELNLTEDGDAA